MTSIQGCGRLCREHLSVAPSVAPSVALPDSFPPLELSDKLFDQPAEASRTKPFANAAAAAISIPKYSKNDLPQILKAVLEARALAPTPAPAPIVFKVPREKLKACFLNIYCGKFHIDWYNFC